ncbi:lipocalin family protein [Lacinutrix algicola]|uniref:lipocalin family protein n=1 Tax=Lacinutrix algicola TaxID=342954 RepID=UPI0006E36EB3|nr:lipocalin family protein [Lacinutrix algicola]
MKKPAIHFLMLFLSMFLFTCDNEPIDPDLVPQEETSNLDCLAATQAYITAITNFGSWDGNEATYPPLCADYAASLQGLIDNCGDPTGSYQALLGTLGDCSEPLDPYTCESAIANSGIAEVNLNNTTSDLYAQFCNAYVLALQEQIEICGDADGSIQATIDGLGDCNSQEETIVGIWKPIKVVNVCSSGFEEVYDVSTCGQLSRLTFLSNGVYSTSEYSDDTGNCIEYLNANGTWGLNGTNLTVVIDGETNTPILFELTNNTLKFGYFEDNDLCQNGEQLSYEYTECIRVE